MVVARVREIEQRWAGLSDDQRKREYPDLQLINGERRELILSRAPQRQRCAFAQGSAADFGGP